MDTLAKQHAEALIMGFPDPFIVVDENSVIKFANISGANLFDTPIAQLTGTPLASAGKLGALLNPIVTKTLAAKMPMTGTHEITQPLTRRMYQASYSPILDSSHRLKGVVCMLKEGSGIPFLGHFDMISEADSEGHILYANEAFFQGTHFRREDLLGKNYRILDSGYHSRVFFQNLWQTVSAGKVWAGEIKNKTAKNELVWMQTVITPIFENGGLIKFLTLQRDVSAEKKKAGAAIGTEKFLEYIAKSNPLKTVGLNLEGNIIFHNENFLSQTPFAQENVFGKNWLELFVLPSQHSDVLSRFLDVLSGTKKTVILETELLTSEGGSKHMVWVCFGVYGSDGKVMGLYLSGEAEDIMAEHGLLVKRQKAVTLQSQRNVVGFVAHELKGGIASIETGLKYIADEMEPTGFPTKGAGTIFQKVIDKTVHLRTVTQNLLQTISKEAQPIHIQLQKASLKTTLLDIVRRFEEDIPETKACELKVEFDPGDIDIHWDTVKIERVIVNLLANALKYSKPEGAHISLSVKYKKDQVIISVADDGIGIPPEDIETVFDLFSRGANVPPRETKSFGVGLKLCKDIVSKHQGDIWLESQLNGGTTVYVALPVNPSGFMSARTVER